MDINKIQDKSLKNLWFISQVCNFIAVALIGLTIMYVCIADLTTWGVLFNSQQHITFDPFLLKEAAGVVLACTLASTPLIMLSLKIHQTLYESLPFETKKKTTVWNLLTLSAEILLACALFTIALLGFVKVVVFTAVLLVTACFGVFGLMPCSVQISSILLEPTFKVFIGIGLVYLAAGLFISSSLDRSHKKYHTYIKDY